MPLGLPVLGLFWQVTVPVVARLLTKHISPGCSAACRSDAPPVTWVTWAHPVVACANISASQQYPACGIRGFFACQ